MSSDINSDPRNPTSPPTPDELPDAVTDVLSALALGMVAVDADTQSATRVLDELTRDLSDIDRVTLLTALSRHTVSQVRRYAASHADTPAHVLSSMLLDPDEDVVLGIAWNPAAPPALLEYLSYSERGSARSLARVRLGARGFTPDAS